MSIILPATYFWKIITKAARRCCNVVHAVIWQSDSSNLTPLSQNHNYFCNLTLVSQSNSGNITPLTWNHSCVRYSSDLTLQCFHGITPTSESATPVIWLWDYGVIELFQSHGVSYSSDFRNRDSGAIEPLWRHGVTSAIWQSVWQPVNRALQAKRQDRVVSSSLLNQRLWWTSA